MNKRARVLIADKWKPWCNMLATLLKDNYEVVSSTNLDEVKHIIQNTTSPFHVVVVDIQFTDSPNNDFTTGQHTLLEQIQAKENYTKVIMLISHGPTREQIRTVARKYRIPLRYRIGKQTELETFDYKRFKKLIKEAANEAIWEEKNYKEGIKMAELYTDFDLHISPTGHAIANSCEGQVTTNISTDALDKIQLCLDLIEERKTNEKLLKDLGKELYNLLFNNPINTHFQKTEAVARNKNINIRLRLRIESDSLARLPLEFMYRDSGSYFLAQNPKTVFSRYLNLPLPPNRVRRREGALHLLIIIANPSDQTPLEPNEWEDIILKTLEKPLKEGQITIQIVKRATFEGIRSALFEKKPDIIQFVGHGIYQNGKGYLALVDDKTGKTWKVDDKTFANIFLGSDDHLGLVSLATCESAKSDSPQGFLGIAPKIVEHGVPAVVAMQYKVLIKTAEIFLENLYTSVAARKPIDWAVQWARNAVAIKMGLDNREFATPVLYMRAENGEIF